MFAGDAVEQSIKSAVAGDPAAVADLKRCSQDELLAAEARTGPLVLTRRAVGRVVDALRSAAITPDAAQAWASFVRRGYLAPGVHGTVRPLEIEFEPAGADQIADAVSRLDEIGDQVDGDIGASELDELARLLLK